MTRIRVWFDEDQRLRYIWTFKEGRHSFTPNRLSRDHPKYFLEIPSFLKGELTPSGKRNYYND